MMKPEGRLTADSRLQGLHEEGIPTSLDFRVVGGTDVGSNPGSSAWAEMKVGMPAADSSIQGLHEGIPTSLDSCVVSDTDVESNLSVPGLTRFHVW